MDVTKIDARTDVIVVGAGPVGLLLGAELALGGAKVLVLERLSEPSPTIKAGSINLASAEALGRRGLLPGLRKAGERLIEAVMAGNPGLGGPDAGPEARAAVRAMTSRAGHFAGLWLPADRVREDDALLSGHRDALGATMVPQQAIEALLADHAAGLGVEVRRGVEVRAIEPGPDGVRVVTDDTTLAASWLVGCDGGRSVVRRQGGFDFPGTDPEITGRQAVVELDDDSALSKGWNWSTHGVYCYGPTPGRVLTVEFDGPPADRSAPVTADELQASLRRVSGSDIGVRRLVGDATRWTDNARQADRYRHGRVLLAGDAAHVHSPFSGQGLNLGLADAMNLGWKLAAVCAGRAEEALLDTYTAERHPAAAWVLEWTRAQITLMRPDPKNGPLREAVADLIGTPDGATLTATKISGLTRAVPQPADGGPVDQLVPDLVTTDGRPLRELFTDGRFVLAGPADLVLAVDPGLVARAVVAAERTLLIRPDGVIAWAHQGPVAPEATAAALARQVPGHARPGKTAGSGPGSAAPTDDHDSPSSAPSESKVGARSRSMCA